MIWHHSVIWRHLTKQKRLLWMWRFLIDSICSSLDKNEHWSLNHDRFINNFIDLQSFDTKWNINLNKALNSQLLSFLIFRFCLISGTEWKWVPGKIAFTNWFKWKFYNEKKNKIKLNWIKYQIGTNVHFAFNKNGVHFQLSVLCSI